MIWSVEQVQEHIDTEEDLRKWQERTMGALKKLIARGAPELKREADSPEKRVMELGQKEKVELREYMG